MALYERLMGLESPKIHVHQFQAMMAEYMRGNVTGAQAKTAFGLTNGETTEALDLKNRLTAPVNPLTPKEVDDVLLLAEELIPPYDTAAAVRTRLGV